MDTRRLQQLHAKLAEEVVRALGEQVVAGLTFDQTMWLMCRRLVESFRYPLIWIGTKESGGSIKVRAFGGALGYLAENHEEWWKGMPEKQGAAARAIQHNAMQECTENDIAQMGSGGLLQQKGIEVGLAIPLTVQNQVLGVFNIYANSNQLFEPEILHGLHRLAEQLSLGLFLARDYDYLRLQGTAVNSAEQAVCITNPEGCIEWVNEAYSRLTGYGVEEVIGTQLPSFPVEEIRPRLRKRKLSLPPGQYWRTELLNTHKDGSVYTVEQILTPLLDARGHLKNFVSVFRDITLRKEVDAQMMYRVHHDPLTELPNRVMFQDRLTQALAWARRHSRLVPIMFLDLDRFKQINDEFGHGTGDKILQTIAARLNDSVRETDTIARLSGDEFTVILQDVQQVRDVYGVAQKILDRLKQPIPLEGHSISVNTSMGIALYPLDGTDPEALLQHADRAMYKAKSLGGQCCRFASEELNMHVAPRAGGPSEPALP